MISSILKRIVPAILFLYTLLVIAPQSQVCFAQRSKAFAPLVRSQGKLSYVPDEHGNRIPDFSTAGYQGIAKPIPSIEVCCVVEPIDGDATELIQHAIDYVAKQPPALNGFRGAVFLKPGRYQVSGQILIQSSGIVLRGSGTGEDGTILIATGPNRRTLIRILGENNQVFEPAIDVAQEYIPVGSTQINIPPGSDFEAGDSVVIQRPSTDAWIELLETDNFGGDRHGPKWKAGTRDLCWDREIIKVTGDSIILDAPITTAMDLSMGGGTIQRYSWPGRVRNVGVENLRLESNVKPQKHFDEDHSWCGITIENAENAWVRYVDFAHFSGYGIAVWETAKKITVEDCKSLAPISEIGGGRRIAFFTNGQQILMQRLWSEDACHDFAVGFCAAGPNVFVQCESRRSLQSSGAIDSWSSGTLFDNVRIDGHRLGFRNWGYAKSGTGWSGANSVLWNCQAAVIDCPEPPGAQNWSFGSWAEFNGDGYWESSNSAFSPVSLYQTQLAEKIGDDVAREHIKLRPWTAAGPKSQQDYVDEIKAAATSPAMTMSDWIDELRRKNPIDSSTPREAVVIRESDIPSKPKTEKNSVEIKNGVLNIAGKGLIGGRVGVPWWRGTSRPGSQLESLAITRFVPGRAGSGWTDDLQKVAQTLADRNILAIEQHPPLWYDRRRDDHERVRRMDGEVVSPFYEWPYARTGIGSAWDGLSLFDLTTPNVWYWNRLKTFTSHAKASERVLLVGHYFQHSILEAGGHYADYPWRSANNVNNTELPEPPVYISDKYIRMADSFYDVTNKQRANLHRHTIEMALDELSGCPNVIHFIGEEFTGPMKFVEFWVDTISAWQSRTGNNPLVALAVPKDAQDKILADSERAAVIDVIDIRYWWYSTGPDSLFTLKGGVSSSPRMQIGRGRPAPPRFEGVANAVSEYRKRYPHKAVIFSARSGQDDTLGWAALVAGGSMATIQGHVDQELLKAIAKMKPLDLPPGQWGISDGTQFLLAASEGIVEITLPKEQTTYLRTDINVSTSKSSDSEHSLGGTTLIETKDKKSVVWLRRK